MSNVIDILMSTYNGEPYLSRQIDSIVNQEFTRWRLLIRDDCSTDKTQDIINSYKKRYPDKIEDIPNNEGNVGVTRSFSLLASQSDAGYVAFCDQDDIWLPEKLADSYEKMRVLEKKYGADVPIMVFSDLKVVDKNLHIIDESFWKYQKIDPSIACNLYGILAQNVVTGCTVLLNSKAKEKSFPIPTTSVLHDHWIAINTCKYGVSAFIDKPLVLYRQHEFNEQGALRISVKYYISKTIKNIKNIRHYLEKYRCLSFKVSLYRIFFKKIVLNMKRLAL